MNLKKYKHIALGLAAYAAAMYLFNVANDKLDGLVDEGFGNWKF